MDDPSGAPNHVGVEFPPLTLLELQSHVGDKPLKFQTVCPQLSPKREYGPKRVQLEPSVNRTAVSWGSNHSNFPKQFAPETIGEKTAVLKGIRSSGKSENFASEGKKIVLPM